MTALYKTANPYGKLSIDELEKFEKVIKYRLPEDYRHYLLNFNGAEPINTVCHISDAEGRTSVHNMLGIHDGPEYARLEPEFGDRNSTKKTGLLAFAYDEGGNYFCLCLLPKKYGEVYFYDHERSHAKKIKTLVKITNSFNEFIAPLISEEAHELILAETDPVFYARLQHARANPQI
ncbi:SMI1/KNR4 family protein [Psychrobacter sp. M13]|uniref:SMI1/KNR4 family protein n=1 Tax=Psychrobacter sp. M13 TaxID=3067275 RepID=UPI00273CA96C|nr:SMI1/KNR4 family protein [Psychrobacter sp. M13]WLP94606.1 SMI1/KNR4 family protein [Psychrobacter sp. M13]